MPRSKKATDAEFVRVTEQNPTAAEFVRVEERKPDDTFALDKQEVSDLKFRLERLENEFAKVKAEPTVPYCRILARPGSCCD
jgi:hypothetical protein